MLEFNDKVMVALLPMGSDWGPVELPHLTLVYAGAQQDQSMQSLDSLSKTTLDIALVNGPITLPVLAKDVFGEGTDDSPKVDVIRFHTTLSLIKMREMVHGWNASKHPFSPHMTLGPEGTWIDELPNSVTFDRVAFCNGDQRQVFRLNRGTY